MNYTAIIKDGGLFIPNVFSDLNDGHSHIVQVEVDIEDVRQQLNSNESSETKTAKVPRKQVKKQPKKETQKASQDIDSSTRRKSAVDELAAFDDAELSEMLKAYMNDGHVTTQISLENL